MSNQPLATAPAAPVRANIDLATLTPLVCDAIGGRIAAQGTFTAYDITVELRDANPGLNIEHVAVKGLVRTIMRLGAVLTGAYTEAPGTTNGGQALEYAPAVVVSVSAPATPAVAGLLAAPAPFAPVV
jgi:hypothetical protein